MRFWSRVIDFDHAGFIDFTVQYSMWSKILQKIRRLLSKRRLYYYCREHLLNRVLHLLRGLLCHPLPVLYLLFLLCLSL